MGDDVGLDRDPVREDGAVGVACAVVGDPGVGVDAFEGWVGKGRGEDCVRSDDDEIAVGTDDESIGRG